MNWKSMEALEMFNANVINLFTAYWSVGNKDGGMST